MSQTDDEQQIDKILKTTAPNGGLHLETRFGVRAPTTSEFGLRLKDRHTSYQLLKNGMPELDSFMPDMIGLNTLYKMRRDPMIKLGLHFIKVPLMNARWEIQGPDEEVVKFLTYATELIWRKFLGYALTALEFGYAGMVKRWKIEKPPEELEVWKGGVDPILPDDIYALAPSFIAPRFTEAGRFNGILYTPLAGEKREIPDEYVIWFTHDLETSFGNLYGYPRIGYAYPYWRSYWFRWLLYDRHFEQDADPPLVIFGPSGTYTDEEGNIRRYSDDGLAIGNDLRSGSSIYLPSTPYIDARTDAPTQAKQWDVRFEYGGTNIQGFQDTFEYLDVMKLRSILVPEQALVEGKGGTSSRNVAATYGAAFADSQSVLMKQLDDCFNEFYLDKIAFYNYGIQDGTYKKVTKSFLEENGDLMGEVLKAVGARDPLAAGINVPEMARELQFPMLTDEELAAAKAEKKQEAQDQMEMMQAQRQQSVDNANAQRSQDANKRPGRPLGAPNINSSTKPSKS